METGREDDIHDNKEVQGMTRRQESGMALIVLAIILLLLFLTSCSANKVVTEYVAVHDTTFISHTDTVSDVRYVTRTDTVRETITREIVLRQDTSGLRDTIRINTFNDRYRYVYVGDSSSTYRAVVDSLKAIIDKDKKKETVKKKTRPSLWELGIFGVFIILTISIVWRIK